MYMLQRDVSRCIRNQKYVNSAGNLWWFELDTGVSHALGAQKWEEVLTWMKRSLTPIASWFAAAGAENRSWDLKEITRQGHTAVGKPELHGFHLSNIAFSVTFLLAEVGGRLQFVMLKYERTEPGRVKAHGRGLSAYSGLWEEKNHTIYLEEGWLHKVDLRLRTKLSTPTTLTNLNG